MMGDEPLLIEESHKSTNNCLLDTELVVLGSDQRKTLDLLED
jgi:hypothetical protein